jgi:elongin-C
MNIEDNHQEIDDNDDDNDAVQYVKLVSAEGYEFYVDRQIAISSSTTIRTMLSGSFLEGKENIIRLPDMAGYILERLVRYMHYKAQYSNSTSRIPEFVRSNTLSTQHALARNKKFNLYTVI